MAARAYTNLRYRSFDDDSTNVEPNDIEVDKHNGLPVMVQGVDGQRLEIVDGRVPTVPNKPFNITGQTTNVIKVGRGRLGKVTFNKPLATSVVTITDGVLVANVVTGTVIATITIPASPMLATFDYDVEFQNGLIVVQATASSDLTVTYR